MALAPDGPTLRRMSLKAGRKDSVASVAKRYRVNAAQVAQWNGVDKAASFKPGQTIVVFVAGKAAGKPAGTKVAKAGAHKVAGKASSKPATRTAAASQKTAGKHARAGTRASTGGN